MSEVVKPNQLTQKQAIVIEALKANAGKMFAREIAELHPDVFASEKGVNAIMTHLVKNGLVAKDLKEDTRAGKDGNSITKEYTVYFVTEDGAAFDYTIKA